MSVVDPHLVTKTCLRICVFIMLVTGLLVGLMNTYVEAQGTTGTILGTVTDSSGGAVPDATVRITNTGTSATQVITSDAQGRYSVPDLPVGDYQVGTEKSGFQNVVHQGITLSAGANVVVDFSLPVGQVAQTVTVQGNVTQVETSSAAISSTVEPQQMRDLPLNGRDFEQLILLAPGAVQQTGGNTTANSFVGFQPYWSVSGSRSNGQGELLDGTDIQNYENRGSGSGILGTTLGVDAITEFQLLTHGYGAQYGGNGVVVNAVTRSGTNDYHGSAYEFVRNAAMDARNFFNVQNPPFSKNQYGATLGGPIKKNKMFFFVNYEGINQNTGETVINTLPDALAQSGVIPIPSTGVPAACTTTGEAAGLMNCGLGSPNAAKFAVIQPYLNLYPSLGASSPVMSQNQAWEKVTLGNPVDLGNGTEQMAVTAQSPGMENYVVGRYDWTMSEKDSLFARYVFDGASLKDPFYNSWPMFPEYDRTRNQFTTIGQKHIVSNDLINSLQGGYTRTFINIEEQSAPGSPLNYNGDMFVNAGEPVVDGTLGVGSGVTGFMTPLDVFRDAQNKISLSDDLFWIKGAHSLRFGGGLIRIQTNNLHPYPSDGQWSFSSLTNFMLDTPSSYTGACNYYNTVHPMPGCVEANGSPDPFPSAQHDARETDFAMYVQDDWRVSSTLTLNLGLRYAPTTDPWDAMNTIYQLVPVPYGSNGNLPPSLGTPAPTSFTAEHNFMLRNDSFHNIDPRIGLAWDPFKDHKTSVRAAYGIYHIVMAARDYAYGESFGPPFTVQAQTTNLSSFPLAFQTAAASQISITYGINPYDTTPYMQQYNLSIQRQVMKNTVLTVAYVGSHGTHLLAQQDMNPPVALGQAGAISLANGQSLWPSFSGQTQSLVFTSGTGTNTGNGVFTCASAGGCTLATASGQPIVDPSTGLESYAHVLQSGTSYSIQANTRVNPNFANINGAASESNSSYNALQAGLVRQLSSNLSLQVSYTYSECMDISSGNEGYDSGHVPEDTYDPGLDRGPCVFMTRHNLTTNGLYLLPFTRNRLVSGWQIGGIFSFFTGEPVNGPTIGYNQGADIIPADQEQRPNYSASAPGCNGQPLRPNPVTGNGVFWYNPACFTVPITGEPGNLGRSAFFGPDSTTLSLSLQKNTRISERLNLQLRAEFFNVLNNVNFGTPAGSFSQGSTASAATVITGTPNATFGQITTAAAPRQIQLSVKMLF